MPMVTHSDPYRISEYRTDWQQGNDRENNGVIYTFALNNETPDAYQIVTAIANFAEQYAANVYVRGFVEKLFPDGMTPNNQPAQYNAVASFVLTKLVYVADPVGIEYLISPLKHLDNICQNGVSYGDCDDHVLLLNSMLGSIGFETHVVGVKANPTDTLFNHVISLVNLGGKQYYFDACNKTNPYAIPPGQLLII